MTLPRSYEVYVFDFDGTLFTIPVDWKEVRAQLAHMVGRELESSPLFGALESMLRARPELRDDVFGAIDRYELAASESARPLGGAVELLAKLHSGARVGLVTMQGGKALGAVVRRFGLGASIDALVTREYSLDRAEQLLAAVGKLKSTPALALFVGDRVNDVLSAQKVGIDVAVIRGRPIPEAKPTYQFSTLREFAHELAG